MILKSRNKEYKPKYNYPNFVCYINSVDKNTFGIKDIHDNYISSSSSESYLDAEEAVYRNFLLFKKCDGNHNWVRTYSHAKVGHCNKCNLHHNFKFKSPYVCNEDGCNEIADFDLLDSETYSNNSQFCFKHFHSNLNKQIQKNIEHFDEINASDIDYVLGLIFTKHVLDEIHNKNKFLLNYINKKESYIESLSYLHFQNEIKKELMEVCEDLNVNATLSLFWAFRAKLLPFDIKMFSDLYLESEGYEVEVNDTLRKENKQRLKEIVNELDLSDFLSLKLFKINEFFC